MQVAVVGTGYVGLVTGVCLAELGHTVTCIDRDTAKLARLKAGVCPIYEPELEPLMQSAALSGRLHFTDDARAAVKNANCVLIAVGTPSSDDGTADLSQVFQCVADFASALGKDTVVVTKSTVPVGTTARVQAAIRANLPDHPAHVASNPEFLREGCAVEDFMNPARIVVGAEREHARTIMRALYAPLIDKGFPLVMTTPETSELIKYASNAFLATKITFINEMADLCENVGADVRQLAFGMGLDGRIGNQFLNPGPGYGGSCFPKDTLALAKSARDAGSPTKLIEAVIAANTDRKRAMADKIIAACGGSVTDCDIAILGVAFKANTDDMRDAPSLDIIPALQAAGARVRAYDPAAMEIAAKILPGVTWYTDAQSTLKDAHAVVILTEWPEFRALDLKRAHKNMARAVMIDLRNILRPETARSAGFAYTGIGMDCTR
jgi:UDPglucose 6-dehydrogenase